MQLPPELEDAYWQQVQSYEEEQNMAYVTYAERRGIEQGIEQAALYFRRMLLDILDKRAEITPERRHEIEQKVEQLSEPEALAELGSLALEDDGLGGFSARIDELLAQVDSE